MNSLADYWPAAPLPFLKKVIGKAVLEQGQPPLWGVFDPYQSNFKDRGDIRSDVQECPSSRGCRGLLSDLFSTHTWPRRSQSPNIDLGFDLLSPHTSTWDDHSLCHPQLVIKVVTSLTNFWTWP